MIKNKYKVGDLVLLNELHFTAIGIELPQGKVGVVTEILTEQTEDYEFLGHPISNAKLQSSISSPFV